METILFAGITALVLAFLGGLTHNGTRAMRRR